MSKFNSISKATGILPGIGGVAGIGPEKLKKLLNPDIPEPTPLPAFPTSADPEIEAARKRQRDAERLRSGRRASMITGGKGVTEPLGSVGRPEARAANLLGG